MNIGFVCGFENISPNKNAQIAFCGKVTSNFHFVINFELTNINSIICRLIMMILQRGHYKIAKMAVPNIWRNVFINICILYDSVFWIINWNGVK